MRVGLKNLPLIHKTPEMTSYKRQYLNLYAPSGDDSTKFMVQQKADEAFVSREDKKIRFYAPDFVIRKKLATAK